jgi:hypothetical protein
MDDIKLTEARQHLPRQTITYPLMYPYSLDEIELNADDNDDKNFCCFIVVTVSSVYVMCATVH